MSDLLQYAADLARAQGAGVAAGAAVERATQQRNLLALFCAYDLANANGHQLPTTLMAAIEALRRDSQPPCSTPKPYPSPVTFGLAACLALTAFIEEPPHPAGYAYLQEAYRPADLRDCDKVRPGAVASFSYNVGTGHPWQRRTCVWR